MRFCAAVAVASLSLLSACALYPIPEDVVRVSTKDIVEHIRCEIRDALKVHAYKENNSYKENEERFTKSDVDQAVLKTRKESVLDIIANMREKAFEWLHSQAYQQTRVLKDVSTQDEFDKIIELQRKSKKIECAVLGCPPSYGGKASARDADSDDADSDKDRSLVAQMIDLVDKVYDDPECMEKQFHTMLFPPPPTGKEADDARSTFKINEFDDVRKHREDLDIRVKCLQAIHKYYQISHADQDFKEKREKARDEMAGKCTRCGKRICMCEKGYCIPHRTWRIIRKSAYSCPDVKPRDNVTAQPRTLENAKKLQEKARELERQGNLEEAKKKREKAEKMLEKAGEDLREERQAGRIRLAEKALKKAFKGVVVGYGFDFTMTDSDKSNIDLDFRMPFTNGIFDLGISLSEEKKRANTRTFDLAEAAYLLLADTEICAEKRRANWRYPIAGEIGLAKTVKAYSDLADMKGFSPESKKSEGENGEGGKEKKGDKAGVDEFTDEIEFTTEISGGPSPVLSLNAIPNQFRLVKMTPNVTRTRKDVHKLTIKFTRVDDKKKRPEESVYPAAITKTLERLREKRSVYILKQTIREELGVK